jgi:hypothetical protein
MTKKEQFLETIHNTIMSETKINKSFSFKTSMEVFDLISDNGYKISSRPEGKVVRDDQEMKGIQYFIDKLLEKDSQSYPKGTPKKLKFDFSTAIKTLTIIWQSGGWIIKK